jgi:hypothetical protein
LQHGAAMSEPSKRGEPLWFRIKERATGAIVFLIVCGVSALAWIVNYPRKK